MTTKYVQEVIEHAQVTQENLVGNGWSEEDAEFVRETIVRAGETFAHRRPAGR